MSHTETITYMMNSAVKMFTMAMGETTTRKKSPRSWPTITQKHLPVFDVKVHVPKFNAIILIISEYT